MVHDMIISTRSIVFHIDVEVGKQRDFEDVQLCQKNHVKAVPLNGLIMQKATDLSLARKAMMYSYITAPLLVMDIVHYLKARKLSLLLLKVTKDGKLPRFPPLNSSYTSKILHSACKLIGNPAIKLVCP